MRVVRTRTRGVENDVKKKIRAIQYGVGPIGASIVRLMREKQAVEIIGAIDTDPAKVGRDLGEVAGAKDAPWGDRKSTRLNSSHGYISYAVFCLKKKKKKKYNIIMR